MRHSECSKVRQLPHERAVMLLWTCYAYYMNRIVPITWIPAKWSLWIDVQKSSVHIFHRSERNLKNRTFLDINTTPKSIPLPDEIAMEFGPPEGDIPNGVHADVRPTWAVSREWKSPTGADLANH